MGHLFDDLPDRAPSLNLWFAKIASTPSDFASRVAVTIPGIDPAIGWHNCRWQARNDVDLPQRGYDCLVAFDDNNEVWVISWWPFA